MLRDALKERPTFMNALSDVSGGRWVPGELLLFFVAAAVVAAGSLVCGFCCCCCWVSHELAKGRSEELSMPCRVQCPAEF